ncbi:MAG: heavy metal transporter [Chloroflexi bacterium 44-23]|nr:MAG: heavy metal transporter [Chloroflexi bacterium 44-23]
MNTVTYNVPGISCNHCVHTIQSELSELEGVKSVVASADNKTATITFEPPANEIEIKKLLAEINYPAE